MLFGSFTMAEMGTCIVTTAATTLRPLFVRFRLLPTGHDMTTDREGVSLGHIIRSARRSGFVDTLEQKRVSRPIGSITVTKSFGIEATRGGTGATYGSG
jgi:hypothetical protein